MGRSKKDGEILVESATELDGIGRNGERTNGDPFDTIEERKELIEDLFEKAEEYAKTNVELFKLKATAKLAGITASLVSRLIVILFLSFFFLMINIGLAIWLGQSLGQSYYGFFIVAGLYAILAFFLFVFRHPIIKNPIINSIISQVLNKDQ